MGVYLGSNNLLGGGSTSSLDKQLGAETITEGSTDYYHVIPFTYDSDVAFDKAKLLTAPGHPGGNPSSSGGGFSHHGYNQSYTDTAGWYASNVTTSANNDTWFTLLDDTSGGGLMHWMSAQCWQNHSGGSPGTTDAELKIKITVDGNAAVELTETDSLAGGYTGCTMFVGAPFWRGTIDTTNGFQTPPSIYHYQDGVDTVPTESSGGKILTFSRGTGSSENNTPIEVLSADAMQAFGVPSFKYETSLKIEIRADLNRSYSTNVRTGGLRGYACITEFD